jgi:hypothetical protein
VCFQRDMVLARLDRDGKRDLGVALMHLHMLHQSGRGAGAWCGRWRQCRHKSRHRRGHEEVPAPGQLVPSTWWLSASAFCSHVLLHLHTLYQS